MSTRESQDFSKTWFVEDLWVSCKSVKRGLKMCKQKGKTTKRNRESGSENINSTSEWLDGNDDDSIVIPLGPDETFTTEDVDMFVEPEIIEEETLLQIDSEEESSHDEDIYDGRLLPLFVSQILRCEAYNKEFKLGSLNFKCVNVFGTVVGLQIINTKNTFVLDDGTAQITCFMEDSVNDYVAKTLDYITPHDDDVNSPLYEGFQYMKEQLIEDIYALPTYDQISVGDKVLMTGKVSLYNDKHYIFVDEIIRYRDNARHIRFMDEIFECIESKFYDF